MDYTDSPDGQHELEMAERDAIEEDRRRDRLQQAVENILLWERGKAKLAPSEDDWFLAAQAYAHESDHEPITKEWLREQGWSFVEMAYRKWEAVYVIGAWTLTYYTSGYVMACIASQEGSLVNCEWLPCVYKTRGKLLKLMRGLQRDCHVD